MSFLEILTNENILDSLYLGPTISKKTKENQIINEYDIKKKQLKEERLDLYFSKIKDACYQGGTYDLISMSIDDFERFLTDPYYTIDKMEKEVSLREQKQQQLQLQEQIDEDDYKKEDYLFEDSDDEDEYSYYDFDEYNEMLENQSDNYHDNNYKPDYY